MKNRRSIAISYLLITSGILISALLSSAEAGTGALAKHKVIEPGVIVSLVDMCKSDIRFSAIGQNKVASVERILNSKSISILSAIAPDQIAIGDSIVSDSRVIADRIVDKDRAMIDEVAPDVAAIRDIPASSAVHGIAKIIERSIGDIDIRGDGFSVEIVSSKEISARAIRIASASAILPVSERYISLSMPSCIAIS